MGGRAAGRRAPRYILGTPNSIAILAEARAFDSIYSFLGPGKATSSRKAQRKTASRLFRKRIGSSRNGLPQCWPSVFNSTNDEVKIG